MRTPLVLAATVAMCLATDSRVHGYRYCGGWGGSNAVMNLYPKPIETFSDPAEYQMAEWDLLQGDTSRPFRKLTSPVDTIASDDGYNSVAFLSESLLQARYGLSWTGGVLAWTVSLHSGGCTHYVESDVIFNAHTAWSLSPDAGWFQQVALHEFGHVLGFKHYDDAFSIMNTYAWGAIGGESLYMDDREGFRRYYERYYAIPSERDGTIYPKYHDSRPSWATFSPTAATAGETVRVEGVTIENLGTESLTPLRVGYFLSTNSLISTADRFLGGVRWDSLDRFQFARADYTARIPADIPPGSYYLGAILDYDGANVESDEANNVIVLGNGSGTAATLLVYVATTTTVTTATTTTITSTTITSTTTLLAPTSTTTLPAGCACPTGTQCVELTCVPGPVRIPPRRCRRTCTPDVKSCASGCTGPKRLRCRKQCRRSIVRGCKENGYCAP